MRIRTSNKLPGILLGLAGVFVVSLHARAQSELDSWDQQVLRNAVAAVADSVVQIETIGGMERVAGMTISDAPSTGTIVNTDGFIVTSSFNLVHQPTAIFVTLANGTRLPAQIYAQNESRQITLLKINSSQPLQVPNFIDRSEMAVGQTVIAVGKTFDAAEANVSMGILSATNRIWGKAIQTDAKISPNNFGGPLIDLEGNILGILVPLSPTGRQPTDGTDWYDSGIGFAVPLNELRLSEMAEKKQFKAGLLGVSFKEERGYASPAVIAAVPVNSPAQQAKLQAGDRVIEINGSAIHRVSDVRHGLGPLYAGDQVELVVERDGKRVAARATLVDEIPPFRHPMLGILPTADSIDSEDGVTVRLPINTGADPDPDHPFETGDRIVSLDEVQISDSSSLATEMIAHSIGEVVSVDVVRSGQTKKLEVRLRPMSAEILSGETNLTSDETEELSVESIQVPEQPNECFMYLPKNDLNTRPGLFLWIGKPGDFDEKKSIQQWAAWCDRHNFVLLMPKSSNDRAWMPTEIEFLSKVVNQTVKDMNVNPQRIAAGGKQSGAAMASLVAASHRKLFRGLVLLDAPASQRITRLQSEAVNRMLVLLVDAQRDETVSRQILKSHENFQKNGFAGLHLKLPTESKSAAESIIRWLDGLDRL